MRRCRPPFLIVPALGFLLGVGGFCTDASAQNQNPSGILAQLVALSDDGMAGVSAKGAEAGAPTRAGSAQPSLQLWDEVRPLARPALPGGGIVTITVNGSH